MVSAEAWASLMGEGWICFGDWEVEGSCTWGLQSNSESWLCRTTWASAPSGASKEKVCKVRKSWIQTEFTPGQSGASISTQMISSLHMKLAWWAVLGSLIGRNCRFSITGFSGIDGINSLKVHSNLRGFFVHKVEGRRGLPIRLMSQVKLLLTEW